MAICYLFEVLLKTAAPPSPPCVRDAHCRIQTHYYPDNRVLATMSQIKQSTKSARSLVLPAAPVRPAPGYTPPAMTRYGAPLSGDAVFPRVHALPGSRPVSLLVIYSDLNACSADSRESFRLTSGSG
jgi:hypothetical protein